MIDASLIDYAGIRRTTHNKKTGTLYALWDSREQRTYDPDGGRWITTCEKHGTLCNHETIALANHHLSSGDWCEECMKEEENVRKN